MKDRECFYHLVDFVLLFCQFFFFYKLVCFKTFLVSLVILQAEWPANKNISIAYKEFPKNQIFD